MEACTRTSPWQAAGKRSSGSLLVNEKDSLEFGDNEKGSVAYSPGPTTPQERVIRLVCPENSPVLLRGTSARTRVS